jgi:hypothetical protein
LLDPADTIIERSTDFAAVHESACGTSRTSIDVRSSSPAAALGRLVHRDGRQHAAGEVSCSPSKCRCGVTVESASAAIAHAGRHFDQNFQPLAGPCSVFRTCTLPQGGPTSPWGKPEIF